MTDLAARTEARTFGPNDLPLGESRRVYLKYGNRNKLYIREGVVINPECLKKGLFVKEFPAFKMSVTRRGTSKDGVLEDVSYDHAFFYKGLVDAEPI